MTAGFFVQYFKIAPYPVKTLLFVILISVAKYIPAAVNDINSLVSAGPTEILEKRISISEKNKHEL